MIKIEAPDEHAARGGALILRAKLEFPDLQIGQRHFILYTTECGLWAVWRTKCGWVARWLRDAGKSERPSSENGEKNDRNATNR